MSVLKDSSQHEQVSTLADALHAMPDLLLLARSVAPRSGSSRFTGVTFWDPAMGSAELRDQIVLGVGLHPRRPEFALAIEAVRSAGATALVVRAAESDLAESATAAAGAALLMLDGRADWAHVANMLRAMCAPQSRELVATVALGDLFTLANTLATLADAAVSIVDAAGQVVGYSTHADQPIDDVRRQTTLALREALPLSQDADYRAVLSAQGAIHLPTDSGGQLGRVARAVRSAGELLGTVWVVQADEGTAAATGQLLDSTEPVVAQHLLQARDDAAERDRRTADLLHALFDDTGAARRAAAELLLPPDGTHTVVCTGYPVQAVDHPVRHLHRLMQLVKTVAPGHFSRSHSAIVGHHVATLLTEADPARVRRFAENLAGRDPAVMVGIGRPATTTTHVGQSHREAAGALSAALAPLSTLRAATVDRRVAAFDDVREQLGLMRVAAVLDELEITDSDDAAGLLALDAANGSELSTTLLTYLDAQQSVRTTAELLHVHQNTIRYRLAALRDDLGVDLEDPTKRLWLWLRLSTTLDRRVGP
ncbi:MAG TPA: helix-turn-helix domain-containing protein [Nakamurella sp.]